MTTTKDPENAPSFVVHSHTTQKVPKRLRLVAASFDGEAIPSLVAATVVLQRIEEKIRASGESRFLWHKHFYLLGGSGIGGLLALLVGRLHIPIPDLLKRFGDLGLSTGSKQLSELKTRGGWIAKIVSNISTTDKNAVTDELKRLIQQCSNWNQGEADGASLRLYDKGPTSLPAFVVVPSRIRHVFFQRHRDARIFRTYDLGDKTTALADVALSAYVSRPLRDLNTFRHLDEDGLSDLCNPAELLILEAEGLYGYGSRFILLLSIASSTDGTEGSQLPVVSRRENERRVRLDDKAMDTHERVAQMFQEKGKGTYVRIFIPGLLQFAQDDFSDTPNIIAKTNEYLDSEVGKNAMDVVIEKLLYAVATLDEDSTIQTVDLETMIAERAKNRV